jgi:hypothetical protein
MAGFLHRANAFIVFLLSREMCYFQHPGLERAPRLSLFPKSIGPELLLQLGFNHARLK